MYFVKRTSFVIKKKKYQGRLDIPRPHGLRGTPGCSGLAQQRVSQRSRWLSMSSATDQDVSTGGGTGTGVQTIVKEKVKEMVEVREHPSHRRHRASLF